MFTTIRTLVAAVATVSCLATGVGGALAQNYPTRPIRLVIGLAPGGATDVLGRLVSTPLSAELGQSIIVENRPGAGAMLAGEVVVKAAADGYTLLFGDISLAINPGLRKTLLFDVRKELAPIGLVAAAPLILVVNASFPARDLQELMALAKQSPGKFTYGSWGTGNTTHLIPELFKGKYGLDILHIPYKGSGLALTDLVADRVSLAVIGLSVAKSFIESGKVRVLAITGEKRAAALPNVPTFAEAGAPLPEANLGSWWGLLGPAGLPRNIVVQLNHALARALAQPELRARLAALNIAPVSSTPEEFASRMDSEISTWGGVVKRANIAPE